MKYRVEFRVPYGGIYFTEWFETLTEAKIFVEEADRSVYVVLIEDEEGEAIGL